MKKFLNFEFIECILFVLLMFWFIYSLLNLPNASDVTKEYFDLNVSDKK